MNLNDSLELALHRNKAIMGNLLTMPTARVTGHDGGSFVVAPRYEFALLVENVELLREVLERIVKHLEVGEKDR